MAARPPATLSPNTGTVSLLGDLDALKARTKNVRILTIDVERQRGEWKVRRWDPYPPKFLHVDTLVSRPYIMCFAAKWHTSDEVIFHDERGRDGRQRMVKAMWELVNEADVLVTYNGDKADIPWMKEEFKYAGLPKPMPAKSIDLYKQLKGEFALPYRSLRYAAREFGSIPKLETDGLDLWERCEQGDPEAWALMQSYNETDVRTTEDLWFDFLPWLNGSTHLGVLIGDGEMRCPNCGSTSMTSQPKPARAYVREYQAFRCDECGSPLRTNFLVGQRQHSRPVR